MNYDLLPIVEFLLDEKPLYFDHKNVFIKAEKKERARHKR